MATPPPPVGEGIPGIASSSVPLLVGFLGNCVLYGVVMNQTYWYYMLFPKDTRALKIFVATIACLETVQTAMVCYDAVEGYARNIGSLAAFDDVQLAWLDIPILTSTISFFVQSFFAWRIYTLSKNLIVVALVEVVGLLQCGAGWAAGIIIQALGTYSTVPPSNSAATAIRIWLTASAACDIIIAVTMVLLLRRMPTHFSKTKALVSKLIKMTIETGTITAVFAVVILILFATIGGSYYACFGALVAKLYSNVALAVLNARIRIMGGRDESQQGHTVDVFVDGGGRSSSNPPRFAVNVVRTQETHLDSGKNANRWEEADSIPLRDLPP